MESKVKVLVTGASGYIGSLTVDKLKNCGYYVVGLIRDKSKQVYCSACDEVIIGDVRDFKLLKESVQKVDFVVHLVAIFNPVECENDPENCHKINLESARVIIETLTPSQRLIFASTESCIGDVPNDLVDEDVDHNPTTVYGKTKQLAEQLVTEKGQIALRFATMFGVSKRYRNDLMVHGIAADAIKTGLVRLYQSDVPRNILHVRDAADSILFTIDHAHLMKGVYNVGSKELQVKKIEIAQEIQKILKDVRVEKIQGADTNCRLYRLNLDKIYNLGFRPTVGLHEGLAELVEYLKTKNQ